MPGHAFRPHGSSTWRARWDEAPEPACGRRRQRSKGGFPSKDAAEAYARSQSTTSVPPSRASSSETLANFLELWLTGIKGELRASTYNWYAGHVRRHIAPALGHRPLTELTRTEVRAFYATLPVRTVERVHRTLRRALYEAVASDLLTRNPVAGMRRPQPWRRDGRGMSVWGWEELSGFLRAADADTNSAGVWGPYFRLLAATGCRRGEGLGLWWSDVDVDGAVISFQRALAEPGATLQETKTAGSRRSVDIDAETAQSLASWRKRQTDLRRTAKTWRSSIRLDSGEELANDTVFTRPDGRWILPCKASQAFYRITALAGLRRIRLHDLRHTHATLLLAGGTNPKVVSERLGHQGIGITLDIYGHVLPTMGREAAALWAKGINSPPRVLDVG